MPLALVLIRPPCDRVNVPLVVVSAMLPPWPGPSVALLICAPPWTSTEPALMPTAPALPDCGPRAAAAISVKPWPPPSSTSAPGVLTCTKPPAPVPYVLLLMNPRFSTATLPALTRTAPAEPAALSSA